MALILAVLLNTRIRGRDVYRAIYFLPMVGGPRRSGHGVEMDLQRGQRAS